MKRAFLGELEEVVLLTVAALQESAYCALITQTIEQQLARSISFPTVHTTLQRLQEKGCLSSRMGGATTERGGRQKRLGARRFDGGCGSQGLGEDIHVRYRRSGLGRVWLERRHFARTVPRGRAIGAAECEFRLRPRSIGRGQGRRTSTRTIHR